MTPDESPRSPARPPWWRRAAIGRWPPWVAVIVVAVLVAAGVVLLVVARTGTPDRADPPQAPLASSTSPAPTPSDAAGRWSSGAASSSAATSPAPSSSPRSPSSSADVGRTPNATPSTAMPTVTFGPAVQPTGQPKGDAGPTFGEPTGAQEPDATRTQDSNSVSGPVLPAADPVSIDIPAIDVHSELLTLGLNDDDTVEVPPLDVPDSQAGWYRYSPTPGELGPSVILGHVDSAAYGPAIFFRLGELTVGDQIRIRRQDGTIAVFRVDRNVRFGKDDFPTEDVYGDIDHAGLRLITCGGTFDFDAGHYRDNDIVFASLVGTA